MKRLLLINSLLIYSIMTFSACLPPKIQAVCKILRTDGTSIQGYITLGIDDCNCLYMNGLLSFSDSIHYRTEYFTLDIKSIEFNERLTITELNHRGRSYPMPNNIKFMVWKNEPANDQYHRKLIMENGQIIFDITASLERKYLISDFIRIYHELNEFTYIPDDDKCINYTDISLKDIKKITFLGKEEITNLDELLDLTKKANEKISSSDEYEYEDFQFPLWYHDVINDEYMFNLVYKTYKDCTILH